MKYFEAIRKKLFGEAEPPMIPGIQEDLIDTAPLPASGMETVQEDLRWGGYAVGSAQAIGHQRKENEDSLLALSTSEIGEDALPEFGLFCVADGAGGHGHGELASAIALSTVARYLIREQFLYQLDSFGSNSTQSTKELMHRAFELSDSSVNANAKGGVTTLTVALLHGNHLIIGHVGDTRAYLIHDDRIQLATRDHSVPWRLVEIGQLSPEEARVHPQRNLLWNAVGKGEKLFVDVFTYPVPIGGYLLLCSDGLWTGIQDGDLQRIIQNSNDPGSVCEEMVNQADFSDGSDNITAVLVEFSTDYGKIHQASNAYFPNIRS
jgi:serine/threonine protein phosphatase PrpC